MCFRPRGRNEVDGDDGLYDFTASTSSLRVRKAHVSPPYASDWIPRKSFKATFTLYNFGKPNSTPNKPPASNQVVVRIAKCG